MPFSRIRDRAPRLIRKIVEASKDGEVFEKICESIFLIREAENENAGKLDEIHDLKECIDTKLDTVPYKESEEEIESGFDFQFIINGYKKTKTTGQSLHQFFEEAEKEFRKESLREINAELAELGEEAQIEEDEIEEKNKVWFESERCTFSYLRLAAERLSFSIVEIPGKYAMEFLWEAVLVLIDAEVEGIEELPEIINLKESVDKVLQTLNMPDCFKEIKFEKYIKYYIEGYQTAQRNKMSLGEYFNKTNKTEDVEKVKRRKRMKELMKKSQVEELLTKELMNGCKDEDLKRLIPYPEAYLSSMFFSTPSTMDSADNLSVPVSKEPTINLPMSVILAKTNSFLNAPILTITRKYDCTNQCSRLGSQRINWQKVRSMATLKQTKCLLSAAPTMDKEAFATFKIHDDKMPAAKTASENMHSLFWRGCTDIFCWSIAYRTRKIPSLFKRRSF